MSKIFAPPLDTKRLHLRQVTLADAPQVQAVFPQWEIVRYMNASIPWPYPDDGAETHLKELAIPRMERGESWTWSIRPKSEPNRLIGLITLDCNEQDNRGFWLDPDFWGQGLMTEEADRVTDYWFDDLGMAKMRIPKAIANIASRRISEKQGMRIVDRVEKQLVGGTMAEEIWEITAEEWRARRS